jgi:glutamine amidotransferase
MVAIIDYDAGNTCSVMNALRRLNAEFVLTDDKETILAADKVLFPGVGHATQAMNALKSKGLDEVITAVKNPLLGICIGMQLMCDFSVEGNTRCLGILDAIVQKFVPLKHDDFQKVPHMGWNGIQHSGDALFENVEESAYVYYVHSYFVESNDHTIAETDYNHPYSAAIKKDNFYGVQFHAEKSGKVGEQILQNFLNL